MNRIAVGLFSILLYGCHANEGNNLLPAEKNEPRYGIFEAELPTPISPDQYTPELTFAAIKERPDFSPDPHINVTRYFGKNEHNHNLKNGIESKEFSGLIGIRPEH